MNVDKSIMGRFFFTFDDCDSLGFRNPLRAMTWPISWSNVQIFCLKSNNVSTGDHTICISWPS